MFANWARVNEPTSVVHVSEFFSSNYTKFGVQCDWNSKNSQNVQKFFLKKKLNAFFEKKSFEFFQNR